MDLVGDAPEERLVDQLLGLEIGREDDELVERHADLLAVGQAEEVVAFFEGDDPAVQELDGLHALAAEVVDQKASQVALQLQRRLADLGHGIVVDFEVLHPQLAAGDDRRPPDLDPAAIVVGARRAGRRSSIPRSARGWPCRTA